MCGSGFNALGPKNGQNRYTTPNNILDALIIHQVIQVNKKYWGSSQVHLVNLLNPEDLHHVDLHCVVFLFSSFLADYMNWVSWRNEGRPLSVPFLICTSRKGTDMATTLELEKSRRIDWEDGPLGAKNAQIGEETCQLSRGICQNLISFTFVAVGVTFLKVISLVV